MWQVLCQFGQVVEGGARVGTMTASTGRCGRSSMGRPSGKGLSCGWGSMPLASTLEPDGDVLKVPKRELIRGSVAQQRCW
ncbi:hypothetical protein TIFTF001_013426 [Ficus carica]|uniref:Uncharacterized protein n=1 Tax=Ficus carica TaxID=3494 RepID=A0AA88A1Y4_FICCA|nr:hypothetical protein TIFTF001_013426 [Ficus carica]